MHVAGCAGLAAGHRDLVRQFIGGPCRGCADAARVVARPHVAALHVLAHPPAKQGGVRLAHFCDGPVQLRRGVVQPAFPQPLPRVAVQLHVAVEAAHVGRIAGAPDAERADADLHPGLRLLHAVVHLLHERVDVCATPVITLQRTARLRVGRVALVVGERDQRPVPVSFLVGIEVVVDVHAIHVVAAHDILDDAERLLDHGGLTRIHPQVAAVALHECWTCRCDVCRVERAPVAGMTRAVRIEPCMQLDAARMCLAHHEGQRIPRRQRCAALRAGEVDRPGLDRRRIHGVGRWSHLKDHRVHAQRLRAIEHRNQFLLLLRRGQVAA